MIRIALVILFALTGQTFAADTYVFDKNHTEIRFTWSHFGISRTAASFRDYDGRLNFDAAAPEKSALTVKINAKSVQAMSSDAVTFLQAPEWFATEKHPEISFKTTKIVKTGDKTGNIFGDLTLKGVTKPVVLAATLNFKGPHPLSKKPTIGVTAKTMVKRSEFGMAGWIPMVSDEVEIQIETEMHKK